MSCDDAVGWMNEVVEDVLKGGSEPFMLQTTYSLGTN